jgi:hypothetical protein
VVQAGSARTERWHRLRIAEEPLAAKTGPETASGAGVAYPRPPPGLADGALSGTSNWPPWAGSTGTPPAGLCGYLGDLPQAAFEGRFHATQQAVAVTLGPLRVDTATGRHGLVEIK